MSPEQDDFQEEDEQEEYAPRSIFAAGWFRAVLVLTVLAIVVVVSLPYLLNWFEPSPSAPSKTAARPAAEPPRPASPSEPPSTLIPAPAPPTGGAPAPAIGSAPAKSVPAAPPLSPSATPAKPESGKIPAAAAPTPSAQVQPAPAAPSKPLLQPPPAKPGEGTRRTAALAPKAEPSGAPSAGSFFVQVGLFKEPRNAEALAKTLREKGFAVDVARVTRGGTRAPSGLQRHELFITGSTVEAVNAALKGRGVAQSVQGGISVRPTYDLKRATMISRELSAEGLKVVIRRAGGASGAAFTVVRVGGFPDRTKAAAVREELQGKGHPGFVTQGAGK